MIFSDLITRIADDASVNSTITSVSNRIQREINRVCSELWDGFRWTFRWRTYRIATDIDVTAGTLTATFGSRTITGVGTSFTSSNVTWHISFTGDSIQNWYKIRAFTSSTQLELDQAYQGTTGSGKGYVLRHFDYVLPTEIWDLGTVIETSNRSAVTIVEPFSIDNLAPVPLYQGYPLVVSIYGSDASPTTYSTGTLSGTINTLILTGSGTSWLANIYPGDLVTIGTNNYTVRSVDSDTQITLYNQQQVTSTAGTTYTITRQFGRILRIMWPSTNQYTLDIRYLRKYWPLVNNNDTNEILYRYPNAIALKVSALELRSKGDVRAAQLEQQADIAIMEAKAQDDALTPREQVPSIFSYRRDRRLMYTGLR